MKPGEKITIVGAGAAAVGYGYTWQSKGGSAMIYSHPDHQSTRKAAEKRGYVGVMDGEYRHPTQFTFTSDPKLAYTYSKTLGWSVRGDVRSSLYDQFLGLDFSEHTALFIPGFREELNLPKGVNFKDIYQTTSTPISAVLDDHGAIIMGRKISLVICGSNGASREKAELLLPNIHLRWAYNEVDLETQNFSPLIHVLLMTGNRERIEAGDDWLFYYEGLTHGVIEEISAVFSEICSGRKAMGFTQQSLMGLVNENYPCDFVDLEDVRARSVAHRDIPGPKTFHHRWLEEDTKVHLVFWYEWLGILGSPRMRLEKVIREASQLVGTDFLVEGSELKAGGFIDLSRAEFMARFGKTPA